MKLARIFLADKESGKWVPLSASSEGSENIVQTALANSPELIPGDQIDPEKPRRWLLVQPGSGDPDPAGKQALVLLDQSAVPTFVLCQGNTGADDQNHSVASMIELATQATVAWSGEKMHHVADETAAQQEQSLDEQLAILLGGEPDEDAFWTAVEDNLRHRRLRLIFVADVISDGLRQMLQFLDGTMNEVDVLALEMKQFRAAGQTALLPRLVGHSEPTSNGAVVGKQNGSSATVPLSSETKKAQAKPAESQPQTKSQQPKKASPGSKPLRDTRFTGENGDSWNETTFFNDLSGRSEEALVLVGRQIFNWAKKNAHRLEWGGGATRGAFSPIYKQGSRECQLFVVTSNGWVELNLRGYHYYPPFNKVEKLERFFNKVSDVEELYLPAEALEKRALLPLSLFTDPSRLAQFLKVFEWAMLNMEASTGELTPASQTVTRRKPSVLWTTEEEDTDQESTGGNLGSYESSFDDLLNRKRVEIDDEETEDST